jgi:hypothetical protein
MRRFVVMSDELTSEQVHKVIAFFRESGSGWWHYFTNVWLVDTDDENLSVTSIRDKLTDEIAPKANCIVMEVHGAVNWAGFGPAGKERNMFSWLQANWDKGNDPEN